MVIAVQLIILFAVNMETVAKMGIQLIAEHIVAH
jgi:hypothetical protein